MPEEPITGRKFITGVVQPKTGIKALAFLPWLLVFCFLGYTVYRFFKPLPSQGQTFVVQPGANVTVQQNQEIKGKEKWWIPSPFVDVYTFAETDDRKGMGVRFGARWEF